MIYAKAIPDMTFLELENSFRSKHFNTYIIAIVSRSIGPMRHSRLSLTRSCL